jgi:hypothetical protein
MRSFAAAAVVAALAGLALWAGGAWMAGRADADVARDAVAARLEQALALPVELGAAELTWLPRPALSVQGVRIGAGGGPRFDAALLRVELAPLALLRGQFVPQGGFALRGGVLEIAALRLEQIDGRGSFAGAPFFDFTAAHPRLGLAEGRLDLSAHAGGAAQWRWSARGRLAEVELARLAQEADLTGLRGLAAGGFDAAGRGEEVTRASLALESDLDFVGSAVRVAGRVKLTADAAGAVVFDLGGARVEVGVGFEKPAGSPLHIAGTWESPRRALRLRDLRIEAQGLRAAGRLDVRGEALELDAGALDLAALPGESLPAWLPRSGRVRIESARLDPSGVGARGELELAGERITASGRYDAKSAQVQALVTAEGAQLAPLVETLWGRRNVSGRLYAHVELAGPLERRALTGAGDFELLDGEWPGLSLARAAGLAYTYDEVADAEQAGLDRFDSIAGSFELADDRLEILDVAILQAHTAAAVKGRFYLRDRTADLAGMVRFDHPDLDAPSLRPILRMAGTLDALETHVSDARSEDVQQMEAAMLEVIRKVESERRAEVPAPHAGEMPAPHAGEMPAPRAGAEARSAGG